MAADQTRTGLEIAVVGMAGRFPKAASVDELWERLVDGVECISFFSDGELRAAGIDPALIADPNYVKAGGVVDGVELFDAAFFGYSPREAALLDPQQRLFLETAWTALEHAGYAPGTITRPVGVYGGVGFNDYLWKQVLGGRGRAIDHHVAVANDKDFLATRVSYKLNLEGPSLVVQTACSTSLVAIHLACQGLLAGECDLALAGGVTIRLPQVSGYLFEEEGMSSPDGHCRAFSSRAQGCLPGNGGAIVVLKRLTDALADGDTIHAVIKGTAINNDGAQKVGYTAPRVEGQAKVIRAALRVAETSAETIGYLEAHGTGTILGDPIEVRAATLAFREDTQRTQYCAVGAVKSNLGHLDAAAGVTGFIKALLAAKHGVLPPTLHCEVPNPAIDFASSPFYVNTSRREWITNGEARRAGVSSFGIGGTNAHVVVEEPPAMPASRSERSHEVLVVSTKNRAALDAACAQVARYLRDHPDLSLGDAAYTLQVGRAPFRHRRAAVVESATGRRGIEFREGPASEAATDAASLVWMFPGQGAQFPGMGRGLYQTEPVFRRCIDAAADQLRSRIGLDLRDVVRGTVDADRLRDTRIAQPAIFAVTYALAELMTSWGLRPAAMVGHSIGEYVAACLAGVFSFDDALWMVSERGALMGQVEPGAMLAVPLSAAEIEPLLPAGLDLAAVNAPATSVVSGPSDAVELFRQTLAARGVEGRPLHTSHAFHSRMMDPMLDAFVERVARLTLRAPALPYVSNVTGTWITAADATDPRYWARHLRGTVRFSEGLQTILQQSGRLLLELGPGQVLTALARRHRGARGAVPPSWPSMRHPDDGKVDEAVLLEALAGLWTAGLDVDWKRVWPERRARRVPLPTYPFQRERHWIEAPASATTPAVADQRRDRADWFATPSWERVPQAAHASDPAGDAQLWVVFTDSYGFGDALVTRLRASSRNVVRVAAGDEFARRSDQAYALRPAVPDDYRRLAAALEGLGHDGVRLVHAWTVEPDAQVRRGLTHVETHQALAFDSLLFLAQAFGSQSWVNRWSLAVLSTNVHEVTGGEVLCPEKALALGPCRTIPNEYAGVACAHIDLVLPSSDAAWPALADRVLETIAHTPDPVVAIRGSHCWRQTLVPARLANATGAPPLKDGGVYMIVGGLGGVGLTVAEHLARTRRARLALVGRSVRRGLSDARQPIDAAGALAHLSAVEERIQARVPLAPMTAFDGLEACLDRVCAAYVLEIFARAGVDVSPGASSTRHEMARRCRLRPGFERLFDRMVGILAEDGLVTMSGPLVSFSTDPSRPDASRLREQAARRYPQIEPLFELLERCAADYHAALAGDTPAVGLLFGEGRAEAFARAVDVIRAHSHIPLCEALVRELLASVAAEAPNRRLRMLEIGGGEGLLTRTLLPLFEGRDVEYHFTDIGRSFVVSAQREAAARGRTFMRFGTLDISKPPAAQGFVPGSVDVVLAFNVMHATRSVADSLAHASELLAPGGLLVLQESVRSARWVDLIWGLTDGWWAFEDTSLRTASPLLDLDAWRRALEAAGFELATTYPAGALRAVSDAGVIVARKPLAADAGRDTAPDEGTTASAGLQQLEHLGAEVEVIRADVADAGQMRDAVTRTVERFGTLDGVIHAALVLEDGPMQLKTRDSAARVLAPKVTGTLVLEEVLAGRQLDFVVFFSSMVSIAGGAGQVDYCAASNVQDAVAHVAHGRLARTVQSIDWAAWREVGMAFRAALRAGASPDDALPDGMSPEEGVDAFTRALASGLPQVLISPIDPRSLVATRPAADVAAQGRDDRAVSHAGSDADSAALPPGRQAPRNDAERVIAGIWQDVLGVPSVGADDNFFDLGGDSVISLQFISKARKAGLRFTNRQVFEHQTVAALAALLDPPDPGSRTPDPGSRTPDPGSQIPGSAPVAAQGTDA